MGKTSLVSNIKYQISKISRTELVILLLILLVGALLRLYKIDQYMTFLGDEGRDAIVVRRLLVNFDPVLIGPGTSIGNMYLGPLYYYLMAPALLLGNFSPAGPAVQIALLGVLMIAFVWWVGREWFPSVASPRGRQAGQVAWGALAAAVLYAISPTVIVYSRSSWNPNIMPLFALLSIYSIWGVWQRREFGWLIVLGVSYAFVLQSHYLGLLLTPTLFSFWFLTLKKLKLIKNYKLEIKNFVRYTLYAFLLFAVLMSPLVIFDARHGWRNFGAIATFFIQRQSTVSFRPWNAIPNLWPLWQKMMTRLIAGTNVAIGFWLSLTLLIGTIWLLTLLLHSNKVNKDYWRRQSFALLFVWLGFALLGLGLYKQQIYDHYFGFFFAAPFLLVGAIVQQASSIQSRVSKIALFTVLSLLFIVNLQNSPLKYPPQRQMQRAQEVAAKIARESGGERFNLAVIAERNYEDGYQYFLEKDGLPVIDIDAQVKESIADQLFVVCEMPREKCDPTHSPKAEVANFGWSKVESEWEVFGVTVFKLVHSKPEV